MGKNFELRTNHNGLKYLFENPTLNARHARWLKFISEFDFEIRHIEGNGNKMASALNGKMYIMYVEDVDIC